ncbi:MAG: hypothetical protein KIS83_22420 [Rubrivivax sp.]|nr:hypothetical protein [Rubrivivax sp.]
MKAVLLHNPGLLISLALLLGGGLVFALLGGLLLRSGAAYRGVIFVAVAFALVVLPQLAAHLAMAVKPPAAGAGAVTAPRAAAVDAARAAAGLPEFVLPLQGQAVRDPALVFGADHALGRRSESRALFAARMPGLKVADAVHWPAGDSVTALVFGSADEAAAGLLAYLGLYQVAPTLDRGGVELQGTLGLGGGVVRLRRSGAALLAVTALDEPALQARLAALPLLQAAPTAAPGTPTAGAPLVPALQPLVHLFRANVALQVAGVLAMLAIVAWWFFVGTAWAGRVPAERGAAPLPAAVLKSRLMAVNQAEVPMQVEALPDGRIAVTWRHADARFVDFASAHRMVRTHRLLLRLDEAARRVHVTEQSTELDARAGLGGASLRWRTELGITFFQVGHRRVFGLQFGPDGRPTGALSYAWRFNLNELKAPFIAAVTGAGWDWQPVMLDLPALLERGAPAPTR